ncbi:DUF427 domain-containing protein [Roseicyclus sp. F158]|uniref:DUF427 domain-containing protein n=1 Tax=Tropicimonas omnivorans TaxID=3075590 RepID=A0ABU3DG41_9RHOB|nr:DUF427 domain-containing protein [Roseicyclus sp. F158]MDT0682691.1 DUF427 domain-containing protein [Roseicyclus sp. F158]
MAEHIKVRPAGGTWVVRAGGAVIAESDDALELTEGDYPSVIYFPREDIAMAFLEESSHSSHCPYKGEAGYFSIITKSKTLKDAAWTYEAPKDGVTEIAGHVAFYNSADEVTVEQV